MVYFIQAEGGGPIKIGCSEDVDSRMRQLESYYGQPLALLATMDGGRDEERAIHRRFGHLRFGRTEQFKPSAELMAFIGRPLLVDANPDAVEVMEPAGVRNILALRGTDEWKAWLDGLAESNGAPVTVTIEQALRDLAEKLGYHKAPPRY